MHVCAHVGGRVGNVVLMPCPQVNEESICLYEATFMILIGEGHNVINVKKVSYFW